MFRLLVLRALEIILGRIRGEHLLIGAHARIGGVLRGLRLGDLGLRRGAFLGRLRAIDVLDDDALRIDDLVAVFHRFGRQRVAVVQVAFGVVPLVADCGVSGRRPRPCGAGDHEGQDGGQYERIGVPPGAEYRTALRSSSCARVHSADPGSGAVAGAVVRAAGA